MCFITAYTHQHTHTYIYIVTCKGFTWRIIVGSRFDDWIYWTPLLQSHLIITAHTLNSLTTSVWRISWGISHCCLNSDWSLISRILDLDLHLESSLILRPTVRRPVCLEKKKAPIWGLGPDFYYCRTVSGLLIWGALSDERTNRSFTVAAGSRQRSHSQVQVPWDSRPYFTVSDSRLPFSSPPATRRVTVEVFDPASTRDLQSVEFYYYYNC
jgi:hypothetical protein